MADNQGVKGETFIQIGRRSGDQDERQNGVEAAGETPSLAGVPRRDLQGLRMYTKPPTWELAPEGPNLLVGSRGSDRKLAQS